MKPITVADVCAATGLGPRQVYRLTREGRIPAQTVGRRFVMTSGQFEQLMRDGIAPSQPATAAPEKRPSEFIRRKAA